MSKIIWWRFEHSILAAAFERGVEWVNDSAIELVDTIHEPVLGKPDSKSTTLVFEDEDGYGRHRFYDRREPNPRWVDVFVFGSNQAGIHGAGAAAFAEKYLGASYGVGEGRTGDCYALPTKDAGLIQMSLAGVEAAVNTFIGYAKTNPKLTFLVSRVGCGLAGFTDEQIAPLFNGAPDNCILPEGWKAREGSSGG